MREKEIIGFEYKEENTDDICPNCGCDLNFPILVVEENWFKFKKWHEYTCSNCGLKWRVRIE